MNKHQSLFLITTTNLNILIKALNNSLSLLSFSFFLPKTNIGSHPKGMKLYFDQNLAFI